MRYDFIETSFIIPISIKNNEKFFDKELFFNKENIEIKQKHFTIEINPLKKSYKNVSIEMINIYHRKSTSLLEINFSFREVIKEPDLTIDDILDIIYFLKENYRNQKRYSILIDGNRVTLDEFLLNTLKSKNIEIIFLNNNRKVFDPHLYNILFFNRDDNLEVEDFNLSNRILLEQFTEGTRQTYKRDSVEEKREFREFSNILWNINEMSCTVGVIKSNEDNSIFINNNFHSILKKDYKNYFIYNLFCLYELKYYEKVISELLVFEESDALEIEEKNNSSRKLILKFYEFRQRYLQKNIAQNMQQQRVIEHIKRNFKIDQQVLSSENLINTLEKTTNLLWNELENIRLEAEIKATNKRQRIIEIIAIFIGSYEAFKVIYDIIKDLMINLSNTLFIFLITSLVTAIVVFIVVKTMKKVLNAVDKNKEERKWLNW